MTERTLRDIRSAAISAHQSGKLDTALRDYADYLAARPDDAQMWSNYGALLRRIKQYHNAERAHRRAYDIDPANTVVRANFANILSDLGKYEESIALRKLLLADDPDLPEQHSLIGRCLRGMGRYAEAVDYLSPLIPQFPDYHDMSLQAAMSALALGDYEKAFDLYKARWDLGELTKRDLSFPEWKGEPLDGKTILVLPEQGFGDCVLMARHLPDLKRLGAKTVIVLAEKPLLRLFQGLPGADHVVNSINPKSEADYWINMMDLGGIALKSDADLRSPTELSIPEDSRVRARAITAPYRDRFKVGIVWTGSVTYKANAFRSFSHTDFLPLTDLKNVQLFSLYKGPMIDAFYADGSAGLIVDAASSDRDFADCAATMEEMDLIISSDTATAHIAGSLGLPTWVVLHSDAFWVYRHIGDTTPWYPTMRLFRQHQALKWDEVMGRVRVELERKVAAHG